MTGQSAGEAGENPLVPNAKLRQMYAKMLEARLLDEAVTKRSAARGSKRVATIRGQEAVRVATTIELSESDLISDTEPTAGMGLILGDDRAALLRRFTSAKKKREDALPNGVRVRTLERISDEEERLHLAVGAALGLKAQGRQGSVVVFARKGEMSPAAWRRAFTLAAKLDLPIIFVALPRAGAAKKGSELSELCKVARASGVPGIPVDVCDAVALYRVTQESLGRTRGGDGAILIEAVSWRKDGVRSSIDDPLTHLQQFLLDRKICNAQWFAQAHKRSRIQRSTLKSR